MSDFDKTKQDILNDCDKDLKLHEVDMPEYHKKYVEVLKTYQESVNKATTEDEIEVAIQAFEENEPAIPEGA